ncbi:MAG: hypothetical protein ACM34K_11685 [Bacillota bacterium]
MESKKRIKGLERRIKELEEKNETLRLYAEALKEYLIDELRKNVRESVSSSSLHQNEII